jgi:23S rRNA (uracil1939-C5)-methyltransferase
MSLVIDDLAFGGEGVGSIAAPGEDIDGIRCFVPFSAPGDRLTVEIVKKAQRFLKARIATIEEPSPLRCRPPCPHFGTCGGCQWQHLGYETQLGAKRKALGESIRRIAGIELDTDSIALIASPDTYGYRSRARFRLSGNGRLAFLASGSRSTVELSDCPILVQPLRELIRNYADEGGPGLPGNTLHAQLLEDGRLIQSLEGGGEIGFYQANGKVNRLIKAKIAEFVSTDSTGALLPEAPSLKGLKVLDLYCGSGNLSSDLARKGATVHGYDILISSVEEAQADNKASPSAFYHAMDAVKAAKEIASGRLRPFSGGSPDLLILDPPRSGVGPEGMNAIWGIGAETVIYLSCDPATLSRDLHSAQSGGYRVTSASMADMFPQTYHLESLIILKRKD